MKIKIKEYELYVWMCVANIFVSILAHILTALNQLHVFLPGEAGIDDFLHAYIFTIYSNNVLLISELCTALIFDATIILVIISIILWIRRKYVSSYRFLIASVEIKIVAYVTLILTNMIVGNCRIENGVWLYVIGIALIIIAGFVTLFGTKDEMKKRNKKWDVVIAGLVVVVCSCLIVIPTINYVKEDRAKVQEIRSLLANHPDSVREDFGYQIGNFYDGLSVYAEGKLYFIEDTHTRAIYSVDKEGNYEKICATDDYLMQGLYYDNGYLYVLEMKHWPDTRIVRVALNSGVEETIYDGADILNFGVADNKLYFQTYVNDEVRGIYYIDLAHDELGENIMLYDTEVGEMRYNTFLARYLYNDTSLALEHSAEYSYIDNVIIYDESIYRVDYFKSLHESVNEPSDLERYNYDNQSRVESIIDSDVVCHNLFDEKLYYVKEKEGNCYEIWSCDLQGDNKSLIGTMNSEGIGCRSISVGEGFVYLRFEADYDVEPYIPAQGYIMRLDDGSVQQIY